MRKILLLAICTLSLSAAVSNAASSDCFHDKGSVGVGLFGSYDQIIAMQKSSADATSCPIEAWRWNMKFPTGHTVHKMLVWHRTKNTLYRLQRSVGHSWEQWSAVTPDAIRAEDPSDGFDLPGFMNHQGVPLLPKNVSGFVAEHGWVR